MKVAYQFVLLRYHHDVATGEFANVGVLLYSPQASTLQFRCNSHLGRLSDFFGKFNHPDTRGVLSHLSVWFDEVSSSLFSKSRLGFDSGYGSVLQIAYSALPRDDGAFQWSPERAGWSDDIVETFDSIYTRFIARYDSHSEAVRKDDSYVWKKFHRAIKVKKLDHLIVPAKISSPLSEHTFEHTYKNGVINILQPLSFDLSSGSYIQEKAAKWYGIFDILSKSTDKFKVLFLLAPPTSQDFRQDYLKAKDILSCIDSKKDFLSEGQEDELSHRVEIEAHPS